MKQNRILCGLLSVMLLMTTACASRNTSVPISEIRTDVLQSSTNYDDMAHTASVESIQSSVQVGTEQKKPSLIISTDSQNLGEVVVLTVKNAGKQKISAKTDMGFTPTFYKNGNVMTALLPIPYTLTPGTYNLKVNVGQTVFKKAFKVTDREFVIQNLTISESVSNATNTNDANIEWEKKIEPLKLVGDPQKYWDGNFLQPVQGTITTEYGCKRYTNGAKTPSRHSGIDIAAGQGTPVLATENGKVQFADYLQLTGYTIVIEHGFGLKSFYYHMNSLNVKAGDMVKQGDVIGAVGTTGYSTGPHLHFAMTVNNVFINPWTMFSDGIA